MEIITGNIDFRHGIQSKSVIASSTPRYGYVRVINKPHRDKPATALLIGGIKTAK